MPNIKMPNIKMQSTKMQNTQYLLFVALIIVIILSVIIFYYRNPIEPFIVLVDDENPVPGGCPEYLYTDGKNYYAHDSRKIIDGKTNPLKFKTLDDAQKYIKKRRCRSDIPHINLVVNKTGIDPTTFIEQISSREILKHNTPVENCIVKGDKSLNECMEMLNDKTDYIHYDLETHMSDYIYSENPEMKESRKLDFERMFESGKLNIYPSI